MYQAVSFPDNVTLLDAHPEPADSKGEILRGLMSDPKTIDPKWFYDTTGAELFVEITQLPEYYPTRTEIGILTMHRDDIAAHCGTGSVLIEPGSGNAEKVRLLLDALQPSTYVPLDISAEQLGEEAALLGQQYPWLNVHAVCADFKDSDAYLDSLPQGRRIIFYPGSTIGNMEPEAALEFLRFARQITAPDGGILIGVDLHKDKATLDAAYNDASGVTAQFNRNVLDHVNALADAQFDSSTFRHKAFYNEDLRRIEMHLVSQEQQSVRCNGEVIQFMDGESIHTENSYKYSVKGFTDLASRAGLKVEQSWTDKQQMFSVHYLSSA